MANKNTLPFVFMDKNSFLPMPTTKQKTRFNRHGETEIDGDMQYTGWFSDKYPQSVKEKLVKPFREVCGGLVSKADLRGVALGEVVCPVDELRIADFEMITPYRSFYFFINIK